MKLIALLFCLQYESYRKVESKIMGKTKLSVTVPVKIVNSHMPLALFTKIQQ